MGIDEEVFTTRALRAYWQRHGEYADIPASRSGWRVADNGRAYVVLLNGGGVLAVYSVRAGDKLRYMRRWPSDLGTNVDGRCSWRGAV
jgi:hypothetical protein